VSCELSQGVPACARAIALQEIVNAGQTSGLRTQVAQEHNQTRAPTVILSPRDILVHWCRIGPSYSNICSSSSTLPARHLVSAAPACPGYRASLLVGQPLTHLPNSPILVLGVFDKQRQSLEGTPPLPPDRLSICRKVPRTVLRTPKQSRARPVSYLRLELYPPDTGRNCSS